MLLSFSVAVNVELCHLKAVSSASYAAQERSWVSVLTTNVRETPTFTCVHSDHTDQKGSSLFSQLQQLQLGPLSPESKAWSKSQSIIWGGKNLLSSLKDTFFFMPHMNHKHSPSGQKGQLFRSTVCQNFFKPSILGGPLWVQDPLCAVYVGFMDF